MRAWFALASFALSACGWAQSALDKTRGDLSSGAPGGAPGVPVLQTLVAVAIVIGLLKVALPKLLPKFAAARMKSSLGSTVTIEETATFTGGQLLVVRVRQRTLLLGQTPTSISFLADLTAEEAQAMAEPAFFELVDAAPGTKPTHAVVPDPAAQLARLENLLKK